MQRQTTHGINRRRVIQGGGSLIAGVAGWNVPTHSTAAQTPEPVRDQIVVDLDGDVSTFDPALTYTTRGWSIVHSIYDALVDFGSDGTIVPLAAETFATDDAITFEVTLRAGMTFHDGSPVTTAAITRSIEYMRASDSQVADLITVVDRVEEIDDLNARIICSEPAAWLPSQLAVWQVLLPEGFTPESLENNPVGSGPYRWGSYEPGNEIVLVRNLDYIWGSPKGQAMAEEVVYRFVPESATRVADLATGQADIIARIPIEQEAGIEGAGGTVIVADILATAFVRIATDVAPFDDPRVRRALNHAVDVQAIARALEGESSNRLASIYPDERALGFDPDLQPFAYDPELARELLAEAGYPDGFSTSLEVSQAPRLNYAEAIASDLEAVGIEVEIVAAEAGTFNAGWNDPEAPPLRYASWRPMYDPNTFLSLVVASDGFLSRYDNPEVDALIQDAAAEPDTEARNAIYQQLGRVLQEEPAAIYLWNAVTRYGVEPELADWEPRGDDYIVLTKA
ncbi:MAG: ABC transporter substrate-binding protein [Chloroflexia bacterium]|jgi:peptide/nickel transport system substrate-binding protein|nr:ABC transporter substrate-binding protein [Chloroflexia bacterium]